MAQVKDNHNVDLSLSSDKGIQVEPVQGKGFKGYIMYVRDPKMVRVVTTDIIGQGEQILSMVKRTGGSLG